MILEVNIETGEITGIIQMGFKGFDMNMNSTKICDYVLTGRITPESWDSDFCTIRYDAAGNRKWVKTYTGPGERHDRGYAVGVDGDGNSYVTGEATDHEPYTSAVTIKYDSLGNQVWVNRWEIPGWSSSGRAITLDSAGCIYVAGTNNQLPPGMFAPPFPKRLPYRFQENTSWDRSIFFPGM